VLLSLTSGEVVGYEALARFDDSRNLPPSWFEQAHRFGLGARLEAEAVRVAIAEPGRPEGALLSVNLSPSALRSSEVRAVLPDNLSGTMIEITEQEEILQDDGLQAVLGPLRERGARIAVDDAGAGAGYAGLQQVMRMQADVIKLDRSLVQDIHATRSRPRSCARSCTSRARPARSSARRGSRASTSWPRSRGSASRWPRASPSRAPPRRGRRSTRRRWPCAARPRCAC